MMTGTSIPWRGTLRTGLIGAVVTVFLSLVGIVDVFDARPLIAGAISLGQTALVLALLGIGYMAARSVEASRVQVVLAAAGAGLIAGGALTLLILLGAVIDIRAVFLHASPKLYGTLTLGLGLGGSWIPAALGAAIAIVGGLGSRLPVAARRPLTTALVALLLTGLFAGILRGAMLTTSLADLARLLFAPLGLTLLGAVVVVVVVAGGRELLTYTRLRDRVRALPPLRRRLVTWPAWAVVALVVLVLPQTLGSFVALVIATVALYVLMGLGLNITLGLAGLLDLGFVAFFAVGAYTVGLLTSTSEFGIADWPFWAAIPFAVIFAMLFGAILGLPILSIREDEDVAEALSVNLVQTKLLAYMLGAAFAGLGGGIFSALIGSIFASSIQLFVSINVVAIVVVGGMGSIPGAVLGAVFLIGVPELFREFSEYRYLLYGFALIAMMLYRPQGIMPAKFAEREVHLDTTALTGGPVMGRPRSP